MPSACLQLVVYVHECVVCVYVMESVCPVYTCLCVMMLACLHVVLAQGGIPFNNIHLESSNKYIMQIC